MRRKKGQTLILGGLLLIAAALLLVGYNLWDDWRASAAAGQVLEQMEGNEPQTAPSVDAEESEVPEYVQDPDMEMPTVEIDGNEYIGTLDIPSLGISLPVMSEWSDSKLKIAPCRYSGTAYQPGFVISGHNYRTHFGPFNRITVGAEVTFTDVGGNIFDYKVAEIHVIAPTAIEEMISEEWDLSLFTCTIGGRTRLTIRCVSDA